MKYLLMIIIAVLPLMAYAEIEKAPAPTYYRNLLPGVPIGGGKVIGGVYAKTIPDAVIVYKESEGEKSADHWQNLAKYTAILAVVLTFAWYVMKTRVVMGMAFLSLGISFGCTVMAEIATKAWIMASLVGVVAVLVLIGYLLRDKSVIAWIKNLRAKRKTKQTENNKPDRKG